MNINNNYNNIIKFLITISIAILSLNNINIYSQTISDIISKNIKKSEHPSVEEAFSISANIKYDYDLNNKSSSENQAIKSSNIIELYITAIPNTYIYQNSLKFTTDNPEITLLPIQYPKAKIIDDEHYGKTKVFFESAKIIIPYQSNTKTSFELTVAYQGCLKDVLCYPPISKIFNLSTEKTISDNIATIKPSANTNININNSDIKSVSEQSYALELLKNSTLLSIILGFFIFGLLLSLTPCILPMLPILSGIIAGHKHHMTKTHAFLLSLTYVLSMAITYMLAGILVAAAGVNLISSLQSPIVIIIMCFIFIFLAISSFGYIELKLPNFITQKLNNAQQHQKGGTYIGVAIMGILSALIISPCATAPLAGALLYISSTGNIILGGTALFSMGFAMGIPILIFGTSAGHFLPKAGPWMKEINNIFGVIFIGLVIYLLSRIIPGPMILVLWAFLLIFYAVHLGLLEPAQHGWQRIQKGFALILAIYGAFLLAGATRNHTDLFHPFGVNNNYDTTSYNSTYNYLDFNKITNIDELKNSLNKAKQNKQYTILDFYADWCISCRTIEKEVFTNPDIYNILKNFNRLKVDLTHYSEQDKILMQKLSVFNPPTIVFFDTNGVEIDNTRITSEVDVDDLLRLIQNINTTTLH